MKNKKVLIVAYYWPPNSGPGVQRWLKFTKYLAENGWEPHVYTPENPQYYAVDQNLISEIHANVKVVKTKIKEPHNLIKKNKESNSIITPKQKKKNSEFAKFIRGNLFLPDSRLMWIKPSVKFLKTYLVEQGIDLIITTGPPQSLHIIGRRLKKKLGTKWIADFRDPWTKWAKFNQFHVSPVAKWIQKDLEKKVVTTADIVTTVTPTWVEDFKLIGAQKCELLTNGYDDNDIQTSENKEKNNKLVISYGGTLDDIRDPSNFLNSIKELEHEISDLKDKIEINFMGNISPEIDRLISSSDLLLNIVNMLGFLPHGEISIVYQRSDVLLLLLTNLENIDSVIPGKLFEYMANQKHILALIPSTGDAAQLLSKAKNQKIIDYKNNKEIKAYLSEIILNPSSIQLIDDEYHLQFSRKNLTLRLIQLMEGLRDA